MVLISCDHADYVTGSCVVQRNVLLRLEFHRVPSRTAPHNGARPWWRAPSPEVVLAERIRRWKQEKTQADC